MEIINTLITLLGGITLTVVGVMKLYGVKNKILRSSTNTFVESLCAT
ncbi:MAG: hypothetical protein HY819_12930 [Acidobacteria bacterium]|nr:hypothetical protein [Acidobacteriota bacterium]